MVQPLHEHLSGGAVKQPWGCLPTHGAHCAPALIHTLAMCRGYLHTCAAGWRLPRPGPCSSRRTLQRLALLPIPIRMEPFPSLR